MTTQQLYQGPPLDTVLVWLRRDLRTTDSPALVAALQAARHVIPVFLWTPDEEGQFQPGGWRAGGIGQLHACTLRCSDHGGAGRPRTVVGRLCHSLGGAQL